MAKSTFVRRSVGVAVILVIVGWADADTLPPIVPTSDSDRAAANEIKSFKDYTDAELTEIAGRIRTLNAVERRALIIEMRKRMATSGLKPKIEAHFGRIIQSVDGTVTRVESIRVIRQGEYGRRRGDEAAPEANPEMKNPTKTVAIERKTP